MIVLIINFLHNSAFTAGTYYLALYYQVKAPLALAILVWSILINIFLTDSERFQSVASWRAFAAILSWFLIGFDACSLVPRIPTKADQ